MITVKTRNGKPYDNIEMLEICASIIETFEDFLDARGIEVPNDEKEEAEDPSTIYGSDFGELENEVAEILYSYGLVEEVEYDE